MSRGTSRLHRRGFSHRVFVFPQLVDDVLDFTSGASQLGKPSAADLKLGLATGPVLFACQQVRLKPTSARRGRSSVFLKLSAFAVS